MSRIKPITQARDLPADPITGAVLVTAGSTLVGDISDGHIDSIFIDARIDNLLQKPDVQIAKAYTKSQLRRAKRSNASLILNDVDGNVLLNSNGERPGTGDRGGIIMAIPSPINQQITDAVTQMSVHVLSDRPFAVLSNLYENWAHSIGPSSVLA